MILYNVIKKYGSDRIYTRKCWGDSRFLHFTGNIKSSIVKNKSGIPLNICLLYDDLIGKDWQLATFFQLLKSE